MEQAKASLELRKKFLRKSNKETKMTQEKNNQVSWDFEWGFRHTSAMAFYKFILLHLSDNVNITFTGSIFNESSKIFQENYSRPNSKHLFKVFLEYQRHKQLIKCR